MPEAPAAPTPPMHVAPLTRPYAEVGCLASFMDEQSLAQMIPGWGVLPPDVRDAVHQRLGRAAQLQPVPAAGHPKFDRIREPEVLSLLQAVASAWPSQPALANLIGFEWVEIGGLIAGRLVTDRQPDPGQLPDPASVESVARFCLQSFITPPMLQVGVSGDGQAVLQGSTRMTPGLAEAHFEGLMLTLRYVVQPVLAPIQVLLADQRAIALNGIERLAALFKLGVQRALCSVSYGYGLDALNALRAPSRVSETLLAAPRPPLVRDFLDDSLAVQVPVRSQATVVTLAPHTTVI